MKRCFISIALLLLPATAQAMTVSEFLAKADALKTKGMMALFSSDVGLLKSAFNEGAQAWEKQAHRPNACPPSGPKKISSEEILGIMRAIPPDRRAAVDARDAIIAGLNRRYSCS